MMLKRTDKQTNEAEYLFPYNESTIKSFMTDAKIRSMTQAKAPLYDLITDQMVNIETETARWTSTVN